MGLLRRVFEHVFLWGWGQYVQYHTVFAGFLYFDVKKKLSMYLVQEYQVSFSLAEKFVSELFHSIIQFGEIEFCGGCHMSCNRKVAEDI